MPAADKLGMYSEKEGKGGIEDDPEVATLNNG